MLRKITSTLLILLTSVICFAQKTGQVVLKYQYLPNKKYTIQSINTTVMNMDLKGVETVGTVKINPTTMQSNLSMEMIANITTGGANPNKDIPFTISYDKSILNMEMNGKKMDQPASTLANVKITGWIKDGNKLQADSIIGMSKKDETTKKIMSEMINKIQQNIKFPERPIKVGDTFNMVMPFKMPMQNVGNINMDIITNYFLKEIKEGKAYLDIKQIISMNLNIADKQDMKATGNGTGTVIYDIDKQFVTQMDLNSKMQMDMSAGDGKKMQIGIDIKASTRISIN